MDIAAALSILGQAIGIAKDIKEIDTSFDTAAMKANAADLYGKLADVKMTLTDARDELRDKDSEIERLKSAFAYKGTLVEERGYKYEPKADGNPRGKPFCPRCEQNLGKYYRLVGSSRTGGRGDSVCPECKTEYPRVPEYVW
ncbi:MAG: hypothetical protein AAAB35_24885 [Phyllobacterium sp.]|uniref:hypothetical protein n=1 Tax=Phyllobacterium sp. TaxID=1871046 RepID=UPI0030F282ED